MAKKTDNARAAKQAKVELRKNVLDLVKPARVFDAYCGEGNMWRAVWKDAASYVGCDIIDWTPDVEFRRFQADNRIVMRAIDLSPINVFDFDAYGSPWDLMWILLHRRQWAKNELGAVVLTDGTSQGLRFGRVGGGLAKLLRVDRDSLPRKGDCAWAQKAALKRWTELARVKPLRLWQAQGRGSGLGGQVMAYTALVFAGTGQAVASNGS
jgi:hypothetical protein